jgi:hypothetical protein
MTMLRLLQTLAASSLLLTVACTATGASTAPGDASPPAPASSPAASGASIQAQLQQAIGTASCTQDSECRTLAWGAKACGGPASYVAWSSTQSDAALLQRLAQQHAQAERARNERSGMVSDCSMLIDPGAQCVAQRCVLRGRGRPAAQ